MQLFIVTLMVATATAVVTETSRGSRGSVRWSRGAEGERERIVRDDFDTPTAEGDYKWAMQTGGGIYHEQRGSKSPVGAEGGAEGAVVQGQYQYTAPDGQVINVVYIADSLGYRAVGAHLPTPPPLPPAIARALEYTARTQTIN